MTPRRTAYSVWVCRAPAKASDPQVQARVTRRKETLKMTRTPWILAGLLALSATACGKVGPPGPARPLYGEKAKAKYQADKRAAAEAKARAEKDDQPESLPSDRAYDPNADPAPQRILPIPGQNPSVNGPAPPGVLPDPFNNPQPHG